MKLLIMCEGPNELKIINILLENQKLKFTSDDLLGLVPYHARQIKSSAAVKAALNLYPDEVHVLRIGDGQNEKLEIPSAYKDKITLVEKYCTKPELEMLLIISEDLADEYEKVKSKTKPKTFAKANIRCGKRRYAMQLIFSLILIKIKRPITHLDHLRPIIKNQCCSCMTKTQQKI